MNGAISRQYFRCFVGLCAVAGLLVGVEMLSGRLVINFVFDSSPTDFRSAQRQRFESAASNASTWDRKFNLYVDHFRSSVRRPYAHRIVAKPTRLCDGDGPLVVIAVPSHTGSVAERTAIRLTWGSFARREPWPVHGSTHIGNAATLVFVVGLDKSADVTENGAKTTALAEEIQQYDDIVQGNFVDDYVNLTLKSLLILKMMSEHCRNARFLLKCDQDVFVNVPHLVELLQGVVGARRTFLGHVRHNSVAERSGKNKVTKNEYPLETFPPFMPGPSYVVTNDLPRELLEAAEYMPYLVVEDVYVTGVLGRMLGADYANLQGFSDVARRPSRCDVVKNRVTTRHGFSPRDFRILWRLVKFTIPRCRY